ncbi:MAG: hypothetical protein IJO14_05755 [Clostridia bacterium]|nr:hypothetical protein [Clostridia bacterium]
MIFLYVIAAVLGLPVLLTVTEVLLLLRQKPMQELPADEQNDAFSVSINGKSFEDLYDFLTDETDAPAFTEEEIHALLFKQTEYMRCRFDCADFRAQLLFKIYKDCENRLSDTCKELIRTAFLNFKYFMDEPGDDSMCYWSENHQLLFAVAEYLAGQQWPDAVFTNNGMTGKEHMQKAKTRIDAWMEQRFLYGFSEYLSNNYFAEDIAPMANFIAYAQDPQAVEKMKIIMDLLWFDVALNSVNNRFVAASSRMYGNNKAGNFYGNSIQSAMNVLWGEESTETLLQSPHISDKEKDLIRTCLAKKPGYIVLCFTDIVKKGLYVLPPAIRDIALTKESFVSRMSCGLSAQDMENEGLIGQQPHQIMAQMGAETFTNPLVINNTIQYLKDNKMYRNSFVCYFKFLNLTVFKGINWQKVAAKYNIMPHGIATGRGNVCTYRTAHYALTTTVCKDTDLCGAQEHIWSANIGETTALFTTHPAGNGNEKYSSSPGYWIGNGRRPQSVQHENVNISIYRIPQKKRLGETAVSDITHVYLPKDFYDETELLGNMVFARKNGVFAAVIADDTLIYKPYDPDSANGIHKGRTYPDDCMLRSEFDLCRQGGQYHMYITELSDCDKETYEQFKERIRRNTVRFDKNGRVQYTTEAGNICVSYDGEYTVNGIEAEKEFDRYDSKFCKAARKADSIFIDSGKHTLSLSFKEAKRQSTEEE